MLINGVPYHVPDGLFSIDFRVQGTWDNRCGAIDPHRRWRCVLRRHSGVHLSRPGNLVLWGEPTASMTGLWDDHDPLYVHDQQYAIVRGALRAWRRPGSDRCAVFSPLRYVFCQLPRGHCVQSLHVDMSDEGRIYGMWGQPIGEQ